MGISGISDASSYEEWKLLNAQKEQAEEAAKQSGASRSSQIESIKATVNQDDINLSDTTGSTLDTVEISSEGRAFLESSQMESGQKAPVSPASVPETGKAIQINDLVDDGAITQAEANVELARRAAQEAIEDSSSADSGLNNIEAVE